MKLLPMTIEDVLGKDRILVVMGLAGITAVVWLYLVHLSGRMSEMNDMSMHSMLMPAPSTTADIAMLFMMWVVMMVAMMTPSAAPMLVVFAVVSKKQHQSILPATIFFLGYLVPWICFSLLATVSQWALQWPMLISAGTAKAAPLLGGTLLIAAGIYQLTPLKHVCLSRCQSPISFILSEWREGYRGAALMGFRHGLFCLGCCWLLMALLFVMGVMNLLWIAALTAFVLAEKLTTGRFMTYLSSALFTIWGVWMILANS